MLSVENRLILQGMELFLWPFVFLLLPLPLIIRRVLSRTNAESEKQTKIVALRVPFFNQVTDFTSSDTGGVPAQTKWPLILCWLFCVMAAARPVWYDEAQPIVQNARNIVLALDTSGSMEATDFNVQGRPVTRLDLVKAIVDDFVQKRTGDEISLVVYGSEAFTYTPLTYDLKTVRSLLSEVNLRMAGEMTAIGDALATAVNNVSKLPADSRIVILLSDGYNNAGVVQVPEAVRMAQKTGVKIYTVGVASAPRRISNFLGIQEIVNPSSDLDEETLNYIAESTGGKYFRATTSGELKEIYDTIDALEKSERDGQVFRPRKELFHIPLIAGLICFLIGWFKRRTR